MIKVNTLNYSRLFSFFCTLMVVLLTSSSMYGEQKVIERSTKKAPDWVMQHPEGFLVAIATGETLQDAQNRVEQELLRKVMSSIAVNVEGETRTDSGVEEDKEWDNFYSNLSVRAAQLPFVTDITLAKCKDTYWVHTFDKADSKDSFQFFVLYPFNSSTRQRLIEEYNSYDSKKEASLQKLETELDELQEISAIVAAEGELEGLKEWFPDMQRRKRAEKVLEQYRNVKRSLVLVGEITAKGKCSVRVMKGDRIFHISGRLEATSNCASKIAVTPDNDGWIVTFSTEDCLEDEDNTLKVSLRGAGIGLKTTVNF